MVPLLVSCLSNFLFTWLSLPLMAAATAANAGLQLQESCWLHSIWDLCQHLVWNGMRRQHRHLNWRVLLCVLLLTCFFFSINNYCLLANRRIRWEATWPACPRMTKIISQITSRPQEACKTRLPLLRLRLRRRCQRQPSMRGSTRTSRGTKRTITTFLRILLLLQLSRTEQVIAHYMALVCFLL